MKRLMFAMALGAVAATTALSVARAEPQVLTDSQMDAVTAAAGVVHLNVPVFSVVVLNIPNIKVTANFNLGDIVVKNDNIIAKSVITHVALATSVGIAVCGVCLGSGPQVTAISSAFNDFFSRQNLP